ncbi:MAG TPA: DUF4145 domain-containing protein, partial [Candidatus Saccharimonadia bacterium]|nr:DUF4145 domain-containing protein [Candidatus Saccharimonadia bacterium]
CPHPDCGALAHQTWFKLFAQRHDKDGGPFFPNARKVEDAERAKQLEESTLKLLERMLTREVFFEEEGGWSSLNKHLMNVHLSMCFSCEGLAIWRADELIYPHGDVSIAPVEEMPADVTAIVLEANDILDKSPRGAAALLRLCVQKLMPHLGEKGKNINNDIASLVAKGLDTRIQKALDVVRVAGNDAVHPGQIDWDDDKTVATQLFGLVNLIVETQITQKKHIEDLFEAVVPDTVKAEIEKRDTPKQIAPPSDEPTID